MIRVGILLDGLEVQAWQELAIREIENSGIAKIEALIVNQTPKSSGSKSPSLYRVFRKIDRILFNEKLDAFQKKGVSQTKGHNIAQIKVSPVQKKFTDSFPRESLEEIKNLSLDVLIRFGFRILKGEILTAAKLGVWSFHHGDPGYYRGGPPAFWEVMNKQAITSYVLMQLTEDLDQGPILYQSWIQTDPLSVQRNTNRLFWASAQAPKRVLQEIHRIGIEAWKEKVSSPQPVHKAPLWKSPGNFPMLQIGSSLMKRSIIRKWAEFSKKAHWQIGLVNDSKADSSFSLNPGKQKTLEHPNPKRYFLADPFSIRVEGKEYLFAEEFDKKKKKGRIVWISLLDTGIQIHPVIEESWHLSYPFIWESEGRIFLIPESSESGQIHRYQAIDFPKTWERKDVFFDQEGYDPTVVEKDGLYWLFITQKAHPACWPFEELHLYWTDNLEHPQWVPHSQSPVVSDVRQARSAGRLFEKDGIWYRPAQDSEVRYGHQIRIQKINKWTKSEYEEDTSQIIQADLPALGIHTWNQTESGTWVDFYFRR